MRTRSLATCALAAFVSLSAAAAPPPTVADLLAQYDAGHYQPALEGMRTLVGRYESRTPQRQRVPGGPIFQDLSAIAPGFVLDHPDAARRRLVVAAFALDLAQTREMDPIESRHALVAWACGVASQAPPDEPLHRWYLASVAVLESMGAWTRLGGGDPAAKVPFVTTDDEREFRTGHLSHARAAFPDEPRWRLAQAEVDEAATATVGYGGSWNGPDREVLPSGTSPERIAKVKAALAAFEALTADPRVAADASLHVGYLHARLGQWDQAIAALEHAKSLTHDAPLRYDADVLIGWAAAQRGATDDAIAQYRAAAAEVPGGRTASVLLGSALGEAGQLAEAATVFDTLWHSDASRRPVDPWSRFADGDGLRAAALLADLRQGLK
jgi:tetratricopeptide (TPR) repeat protein